MENQDDSLVQNETLESIYDVEEQKVISLNKFIFLSIISFGLYEIWWIYKTWRFFNQKEKLNINSALRTIFSIFFLISLFNKILRFAKEKGYCNNFPSVLLFVGYILINYTAYLPDPFWLIRILGFMFLMPQFIALKYAKLNSTDFIITVQTSFNYRQIVLIVVGAILWALVLLNLIISD